MTRIHLVLRGTGIPKDRDEVNTREGCECDGWVCDLDTMGTPSKFREIRTSDSLTRVRSTLILSWEEKAVSRQWNIPRSVCGSWTPEVAKRRSVSRWDCKNKSLTNSLCNLPDVLGIVGINDTVLRLFIIKSIKREVQTRPIYDCRCDERLPKDRDFPYKHCVFIYSRIKTGWRPKGRKNVTLKL
jgi:hypothetical protein